VPAGFARDSNYDAWNRLVKSETKSSSAQASELADITYTYDALGRLIAESRTKDQQQVITEFYHSAGWQNIQEYTRKLVGGQEQTDKTRRTDNVWSLAYVDAMAFCEQRDGAGAKTGRYAPTQDAQWNVTALVEVAAAAAEPGPGPAAVLRRYLYTPYGLVKTRQADWSAKPAGGFETYVDWRYFHQGGYRCVSVLGVAGDKLYHFRRRSYDPIRGQWLQRDPAGYLDSLNLHEYLGSSPINYLDPTGLWFGLDDLIASVGGLVVGLAGQAVGDLVAGEFSGWESYVAAGAGGAAGGWSMLYVGPVAGGAIGASVYNASAQGLGIATGKQESFDVVSLVTDTAFGAIGGGMGSAIGKVGGRVTARLGSRMLGCLGGRASGHAILVGGRTVSGAVGGALTGGALGAIQGGVVGGWQGAWAGVRHGATVGAILGGTAGFTRGLRDARRGFFAADISDSRARSRSGHRHAANKQLHDAMQRSRGLRAEMELLFGEDVFSRTSSSGGRINPRGAIWHHDSRNPNRLSLFQAAVHDARRHQPRLHPQGRGGWSRYYSG